jgi:DNA uptake protein ComE-like DNA-binding protein
MTQSATDLQELKGVGKVLAKRLYDAGFDSYVKIAQAGEEGLKTVRGLSPRSLGSILEQAKRLADAPPSKGTERDQAVKKHLSEVRGKIQTLAESAGQRFQTQLAGKKSGKKLSLDLVRLEDALARMEDRGGKRSKRADKALIKADKRITGLEDVNLKKLHKGLKRARKTVLKALR